MSSPAAPSSGPSPAPGCTMISIAMGVVSLLVIWAIYVALKQNSTIDGFAEPTAATYEIAPPSAEALQRADAIQAAFEKAIRENSAVRIEMTAEDFNTLIASREVLKDFKGNTRVESITDKGLLTSMSQPMRSGFLGGSRFLNGTLLLRPDLRTHTVFFVVEDIQVPGKEVPRGFIDQYSSLQLYRIDPSHPVLGKALQRLDKVTIEGDRVVVVTRALEPGEEKK